MPDTTPPATATQPPGPPQPATPTPQPTNHSPSNNGQPPKRNHPMNNPEIGSGRLHRHDTRRRITHSGSSTLAVVKQADGLVDPPLPGLGRLRTIDRQHMAELVAVG